MISLLPSLVPFVSPTFPKSSPKIECDNTMFLHPKHDLDLFSIFYMAQACLWTNKADSLTHTTHRNTGRNSPNLMHSMLSKKLALSLLRNPTFRLGCKTTDWSVCPICYQWRIQKFMREGPSLPRHVPPPFFFRSFPSSCPPHPLFRFPPFCLPPFPKSSPDCNIISVII